MEKSLWRSLIWCKEYGQGWILSPDKDALRILAMFSGMFMKKPDKGLAHKQLRTHVALFGS
ncbi:unnamed protein product [Brassica oleracea var. botrytis]